MKRIELFKNALDFAYANYAAVDPSQISILKGQAFQAAKFDPADFVLWSSYVDNSTNQFRVLANQPAPSAAKAAPAAIQPVPHTV